MGDVVMANDPLWIEHAHLKKGAFGKKASAAGESTSAYAHEKSGASGKTGKQARLALVLKGLHKAAK
jgi:hypothetical protein